ncbi:MAG TPA: hypothetical protein ENN22_06275 [bacterium]|nr:hypothetical protein [bacterium]
MKRVFIIMLLLIITAPFVLLAQLKIKQGDELFVKPEFENLRLSPNGSIICQLPQGAKIIALGEQGNWVAVQVIGYIWKNSLTESRFDIEGFNFRVLHILVDSEAEAQEISTQLTKGADFKQLATERSKGPNAVKGGDLGIVNKGDLLPELDAALSQLKVGETSKVIKTRMGYHIIKRIE